MTSHRLHRIDRSHGIAGWEAGRAPVYRRVWIWRRAKRDDQEVRHIVAIAHGASNEAEYLLSLSAQGAAAGPAAAGPTLHRHVLLIRGRRFAA